LRRPNRQGSLQVILMWARATSTMLLAAFALGTTTAIPTQHASSDTHAAGHPSRKTSFAAAREGAVINDVYTLELVVNGREDGQIMGWKDAQAGQGCTFPDGTQKNPAYDIAQAEEMVAAGKPATNSWDQNYEQKIITDSSTFTSATSATAEAQAGGWGASVKADLATSNSKSTDSSSMTFYTNSYAKASLPMQMKGCPDLTDGARKILTEQGEAKFRSEFGTHFVHGFRATVSGVSEIFVTSSSSSEKSSLAQSLSASYQGFGTSVSGGESFSKEFSKETAGMETNQHLSILGTTGSPPSSDFEAVSEYLFHITDHATPDANRKSVIFYPHSFCQEYIDIVADIQEIPPVPAASEKVYKTSQTYTYAFYSYNGLGNTQYARNLLNDLDVGPSLEVLSGPIGDAVAANGEGTTDAQLSEWNRALDVINLNLQLVTNVAAAQAGGMWCACNSDPDPKDFRGKCLVESGSDLKMDTVLCGKLGGDDCGHHENPCKLCSEIPVAGDKGPPYMIDVAKGDCEQTARIAAAPNGQDPGHYKLNAGWPAGLTVIDPPNSGWPQKCSVNNGIWAHYQPSTGDGVYLTACTDDSDCKRQVCGIPPIDVNAQI